jgi:hypothetical protein
LSCACRTPESCRADTITLDSLEEVEIESFTGADDQMEFLRQLVFICRAPQLASVKITACPHSPLNNDVQEKIHGMYHPNVRLKLRHHTDLVGV